VHGHVGWASERYWDVRYQSAPNSLTSTGKDSCQNSYTFKMQNLHQLLTFSFCLTAFFGRLFRVRLDLKGLQPNHWGLSS